MEEIKIKKNKVVRDSKGRYAKGNSNRVGIGFSKESMIKRTVTRRKLDGYACWSKGLTKENNESLRRMANNKERGRKISIGLKKAYLEDRKIPPSKIEGVSKKTGETIRRRYREGKIKHWSKGLTKHTDKRIMKYSKMMLEGGAIKAMRGLNLKPNKPERILNEIVKKNNLPFNYVGDGGIWFKGKNHSFNPDFLSKNPKHIIEVFGDYWHNIPKAKKRDIERIETYSKYGYKVLVVWEHELKDPAQVLNKIQNFIIS